jgi:hypothetical protein
MRRTVIAIVVVVTVITSAAVALADPIQWVGNGHWYEAVGQPLNWAAARTAAESMTWCGANGYLATLTSQAENDFVMNNVLDPSWDQCWLGGYQDPQGSPPDEDWHWVTGEAWEYTNWWEGEPNDLYGPGSESCLDWRMPQWNDARPSDIMNFVVEYECLSPVEPASWTRIKSLFGTD